MIQKDIFYKKAKDYTFSVLFFLIFSFSIFFIIRPTLVTLFSLKKQAKDLEEINQIYDQKIVMIAQVQQFLENNREKLPLLKEAIPDKPNLAKVIDDLNKVSSGSGLVFKKINAGATNLKEAKEKKYNQLVLTVEGEGDFPQMINFLEELLKQRRLKMVEKLIITKNQEGSPSGLLKVQMEIKTGYL